MVIAEMIRWIFDDNTFTYLILEKIIPAATETFKDSAFPILGIVINLSATEIISCEGPEASDDKVITNLFGKLIARL